ncbi:MAG: peptidoglycan bridge formation glycyltransferase FemA/FemB family protein [Bacilli bacterium]|nr:peptidoglycan bridge formation glycyltransferase FemA/FemB family protein [Bacilli bacterium]
MIFLPKVDINDFDKFVKNHPTKSHFMQSIEWGELSKNKGLILHFVGLKDNDKLVCTALLLEKRLPFGLCYFYVPRGYVLDYNNKEILKEFTEKIKEYAKQQKSIFIKIDPDIILNTIDNKGELINQKKDNYEIIDYLKTIGYQHKGFYRNFEGSQPRYSFRINLNDNWENIENKFSTTTKQRIKKAKTFDVEVKIGTRDDIETFYDLMFITEKRKNLLQHNKDYYYKLYDEFNKNNDVKLFLGKVYPKKIVDNLNISIKSIKKELDEIKELKVKSKNISNKEKELNKELLGKQESLLIYNDYAIKYPEGLIISAHMIVFYGDKGWVLYAGNHDDLAETHANYLVYEEHIKYALNNGYKIYDQFGTIGDLNKDNPLLGLHEFKRKFGGDYVEFIGEFDLVINKFMYFVFTNLIPLYRKLKRKFLKKKILGK